MNVMSSSINLFVIFNPVHSSSYQSFPYYSNLPRSLYINTKSQFCLWLLAGHKWRLVLGLAISQIQWELSVISCTQLSVCYIIHISVRMIFRIVSIFQWKCVCSNMVLVLLLSAGIMAGWHIECQVWHGKVPKCLSSKCLSHMFVTYVYQTES